jgi:hypothetical protein
MSSIPSYCPISLNNIPCTTHPHHKGGLRAARFLFEQSLSAERKPDEAIDETGDGEYKGKTP